MKRKILIIGMMLVLSLNGCANTDTGKKVEPISIENTETTTEAEETAEISNTASPTQAEKSTEPLEPLEPLEPVESMKETSESTTEEMKEVDVKAAMPYNKTETDETVYVNTYANIRNGPSTEYDVAGTADVGQSLRRTGVLDNGWSEVEYNGEIRYISSKLVQTEAIVIPEPTAYKKVSVEVKGDLCVGLAKEVLEATNAERIAAGLDPLEWSDALATPAQTRSAEIVTTFSHTRPDGSNWNTVSSLVKGENLLRGPSLSANDIVEAWMNSEGHKANILHKDYKTMGVAILYCDKGMTAVQCFGY